MKERIEFRSLPVPGTTVLQVRSSKRLWAYAHEQVCVTLVRHGTGRWKARGTYYDICPANLMVMGAGEFHATTAVDERASFDALFVSPELIEDWFRESLPRKSRRAPLQSSISDPSALLALQSVLAEPKWRVDPAGVSQRLLGAFSRIFQVSNARDLTCPPSCEERLRRARELIDSRYQCEPFTPVDIQLVARELQIDYFWLVRRFSDYFKVSPYQYAKNLRTARARELLLAGPQEQSPTLAAVASRAGFYDYAHMIRDFRRHLGIVPAELAAQVGGWRPHRRP